jgi:hypothetical protein
MIKFVGDALKVKNKKITLFTRLFSIGRKMAGHKIKARVGAMKPYEVFFSHLSNQQLADVIDFAEGRKDSIDIRLTKGIVEMEEHEIKHDGMIYYSYKPYGIYDNFDAYKKMYKMSEDDYVELDKIQEEEDAHSRTNRYFNYLFYLRARLMIENKCAQLMSTELSSMGQDGLYEAINEKEFDNFFQIATILMPEFSKAYIARFISDTILETIDCAANDRNAFNRILVRGDI